MKLEYISFGRTGCCFIKYPTSEEADRAIRALHNQYTLPGVSLFSALQYLMGDILCYSIFFFFARQWAQFKLDTLTEKENALVSFHYSVHAFFFPSFLILGFGRHGIFAHWKCTFIL